MYKYILFFIFSPLSILAQTVMNPSEFEKALREFPEASLVDVRNINQYMNGHIKSARLIDYFSDDFKAYLEKNFQKNEKLFLYAQSESATTNAGLYIHELGYVDVVILSGGFENWIKNSKPYRSRNSNFNPLKIISKENYVQLLKDNKWTMVIFHEDYCEPCEELYQNLIDLQKEISEFNFIKINSEMNNGLVEWLKIYKNPTLILYKDGVQYWRTVSVPDREKIKEHLF